MSWVIRSRALLAAAALLFGTLYFLRQWSIPASFSTATVTGPQVHKSNPTKSPDWTFRADRDRNDHTLTSDQCLQAFPDLYREIDRSRAYWQNRLGDGKITEDNYGLEWSRDGGLRAMIWEGQLYILESRGLNHFLHWKERSQATLHNIQRAITGSREPIPNIEFSIKINDNIELTKENPNATVWNFNRNVTDKVMEQVWLIPDFNFWSYPRVASSYGEYQRQAIEIGEDYNSKTPKLVWRGTTDFNPEIRLKLIEQSEGKSWSDVHRVAEDVHDEEATKYRITMPDHCKYKFAVHTEGTTWSGRLKYLLSCHSTILIHPLTFTTHLYHLLEDEGPNQNYVKVDKAWTELPAKMDELLADNAKAKRIADNAATKLRDRYFTPAAQMCYFRHLFNVWAEMTPAPNPFQYITHADGTKSKEWRGMAYEEYVFLDKGYND
ncbi:hypothetical protein DOTSEDRAFT_67711 [Dothistroma septosporum NZE10]|uniref:Glycosyl transferase CAP10 domain-containing protein n=1 Tax=Dothistroma septosporum (strain NZE10 / CBS 128990) TaxID=675120 RepID=N1Q2Q9_DOTSN|nr:hypothetical protein DOTSEDRAFT_67711 [Dothistroma septosporum NZE10]